MFRSFVQGIEKELSICHSFPSTSDSYDDISQEMLEVTGALLKLGGATRSSSYQGLHHRSNLLGSGQ